MPCTVESRSIPGIRRTGLSCYSLSSGCLLPDHTGTPSSIQSGIWSSSVVLGFLRTYSISIGTLFPVVFALFFLKAPKSLSYNTELVTTHSILPIPGRRHQAHVTQLLTGNSISLPPSSTLSFGFLSMRQTSKCTKVPGKVF